MRITVVFFLLAWLGLSSVAKAEVLEVIYPHPPSEVDTRAAYAVNVLKLALEKTEDDFGAWSVAFSPDPLERPESEAAVLGGEIAQVLMLPGTNKHDRQFRLVPFPIDKGLIGYRIALVNTAERNILADVQVLSDLEAFNPCLMETWNITRLFEFNGLQVNKSSTYEELFSLVDQGKCDYFSRGVGEILGEFGYWSQTYPKIAIEPHVMMRAPLAFYLYISKNHEEMAQRIETGLARAIVDGSFERLFQKEFSESIRALRLLGRRVVDLAPLEVHDLAPTGDKGLWFKP